jgi:DNA polymerase-3 subunit gamma/tau
MPDSSSPPRQPYQVLARKYRPQNFDDLIGHGPMVTTLRNAFASGRIAHAFVLTGVRGVGKTTTARIMARALNYVAPDGKDAGPTIDLKAEGLHCRAIAESRHPDVIEMDAASRTGVGDVRELIDGVRYAPIEARYKVYIIDEVHMLSTAAFNALLKTLEEPPPHVKFIFATTEIRKLPVTVLSRCQRFDLRRIDQDALADHLEKIVALEGAQVERDGLAMIARAAEGSVRDALSILDQALVQRADVSARVSAAQIRDMLGLADRSQTWDLVEAAFRGDGAAALSIYRSQYDAGADPSVILKDLMEIAHLLTRIKVAGESAAAHGRTGEADAARAAGLARALPMAALTRAWSLLLKGHSEAQIAPDPAAAGEMALIRLAFAADLPTPDEALRALKSSPQGGDAPVQSAPRAPRGQPAAMAAAEPRFEPAPKDARPQPTSFLDVVRLAEANRDLQLKVELEAYAHLVDFAQGKITLRLAANAPRDLANRLSTRLFEWTGARWFVSLADEGGAATVRDERTRDALTHPLVKAALQLFPGATLVSVRDPKRESDFPENESPAPDGDLDTDTE